MRLHLKISLWTLAILLVVGGLALYALSALQRSAALHQFEHMAATLTETILNSLEITMIHNNQDEMREIIALIRREEMIQGIAIYGRDGRVWAPAEPDDLRGERVREAVACAIADCRRVSIQTNGGELVVVTPVANKPACLPCHAGDPPVLGAISVSLRTAPVTEQLRQSARVLGVLVGFAFLFALGTLNLLLGRFVLDPLTSLAATVRRIAGGEYRARTPVRRRDELGDLARSVNDMAAQIEDYTATLSTQVGDLTRRLASLGIFGRVLTGAPDLAAAMAELTPGIAAVVRADAAAIYQVADGRLQRVHATGAPLPETIPLAADPLGDAVRRGVPVHAGAAGTSARPGAPGAALAVPVLAKDRALGALVVGRRAMRPFADTDASLLRVVADQLATAMENVRLLEEVRANEAARGELLSRIITAQEDERRRIARELHDEVSQSLTSLMIRLTAAQEAAGAGELRARLEAIYASAEATLDEVGKLIADLRPTALDDLGLVPAVRMHARNLLEAAGVRLAFEAHGFGQRRLPAAVEATAFRVAQEAITNIARHARARAAAVSLRLQDGTLTVVVEDDGVGFDPAGALRPGPGGGAGLLGMRERATLIGGDLEIAARPGAGTRVRLTVPVERRG